MNEDFSKRTPGPWRVVNHNGFNNEIVGIDGKVVADCITGHLTDEQERANAAFIAHAVNCYDDLIEALVIIADQHIGDQPSAIDIDEAAWNARCHSNLRTIARQALVKANGET